MPLRKLGRVKKDPVDTKKRQMKTLAWADAAALNRFRENQPSQQDLEKAQRAAEAIFPKIEKLGIIHFDHKDILKSLHSLGDGKV